MAKDVRGGKRAAKVEEEYGFVWHASVTPEEAVAWVNADRYMLDKGFRNNCQRCVWAYEMQRRGFDVVALPSLKGDTLAKDENWLSIIEGGGQMIKIGDSAVNNPPPIPRGIKRAMQAYAKVAEAIRLEAAKWGEGSRGIMSLMRGNGVGHTTNFEYSNGKVTIYDAQVGEKTEDVAGYLNRQKAMPVNTKIIRTDNLKLKSSEYGKYFTDSGVKRRKRQKHG